MPPEITIQLEREDKLAGRAYAKRYAQAVFQIAREKGEFDKWQSDLKKITSLGEDAALSVLLENPKINFSEKVKLLSEGLNGINPLALNLVYLLVAKGNWSMVAEVADEYRHLLDSYRGIVEAEVITAVPLDDKDTEKLKQRLKAILDKEVVVRPAVDPGLVGGVLIRFDGKLLDGSTRSRLKALNRELGGRARG